MRQPSSDARTKMYRRWKSMRQRCMNKNHPFYPAYGGRGIGICERWDCFDNFLGDMGYPPSPGHSLDRIDADKGYSPENCRWATLVVQARNRTDKLAKYGCRGISKYRGKYKAYINVQKKQIHLGSFDSLSDAVAARKEGEIQYWSNAA